MNKQLEEIIMREAIKIAKSAEKSRFYIPCDRIYSINGVHYAIDGWRMLSWQPTSPLPDGEYNIKSLQRVGDPPAEKLNQPRIDAFRLATRRIDLPSIPDLTKLKLKSAYLGLEIKAIGENAGNAMITSSGRDITNDRIWLDASAFPSWMPCVMAYVHEAKTYNRPILFVSCDTPKEELSLIVMPCYNPDNE